LTLDSLESNYHQLVVQIHSYKNANQIIFPFKNKIQRLFQNNIHR